MSKLNELEFLGVNYMYELNMAAHGNCLKITFENLRNKCGQEVVEAYIKEMKRRHPNHPVFSII